MTNIHPTAVIAPGAVLHDSVTVGPYCVIGAGVTLGEGCALKAHVVLDGKTTIGAGNVFYPFVSIGQPPQDLKFNNEPSEIVIGDNNTFREHVTVNPGTEGGIMKTVIGDHCLLMVGVHVAHDCVLGNHVIMANNATLAGHVTVGDFAVIGGLAAVHQFVRIGDHAMIGGLSGVESDIIPYGQATGERAFLTGVNLVGLKRRGYERSDISALRDTVERLFTGTDEDGATLKERAKEARARHADAQTVQKVIDFIEDASDRGLCKPKQQPERKPHPDKAA